MTKLITLLFALIFSLNGYTQNYFLKGYYIDNSNKKVNCFIKNMDWLNNPTKFNYKLLENSEIKTLSTKYVKEFGILNVSKYIKYTVDIDRSSKKVDEINYDKNPIFNKEELFLKVLIEGKANLYLYADKGLTRYFFNKEDTDVKQLIYKNYLNSEGLIAKNNQFRQQLRNTLKCQSISISHLLKLNYKQNELIKFFKKYNECSNSEFVSYQKKTVKKGLFNLTIRPGLKNSSLILGGTVREVFDFGKGLSSSRFGVEAEFVLGFNNNKWALILEPAYQNLKSETKITSNQTTGEELFANFNHESIEVHFGIRHYVFLNKDLKLFVNASGIFDNNLKSSSIQINRESGREFLSFDINSGISMALGVGCKLKERYNLELRYIPERNILNDKGPWGTKSESLSMILGYSIF